MLTFAPAAKCCLMASMFPVSAACVIEMSGALAVDGSGALTVGGSCFVTSSIGLRVLLLQEELTVSAAPQ